jgi:hypothetical protein
MAIQDVPEWYNKVTEYRLKLNEDRLNEEKVLNSGFY